MQARRFTKLRMLLSCTPVAYCTSTASGPYVVEHLLVGSRRWCRAPRPRRSARTCPRRACPRASWGTVRRSGLLIQRRMERPRRQARSLDGRRRCRRRCCQFPPRRPHRRQHGSCRAQRHVAVHRAVAPADFLVDRRGIAGLGELGVSGAGALRRAAEQRRGAYGGGPQAGQRGSLHERAARQCGLLGVRHGRLPFLLRTSSLRGRDPLREPPPRQPRKEPPRRLRRPHRRPRRVAS